MAVQMHISFSSLINGTGVFAAVSNLSVRLLYFLFTLSCALTRFDVCHPCLSTIINKCA